MVLGFFTMHPLSCNTSSTCKQNRSGLGGVNLLDGLDISAMPEVYVRLIVGIHLVKL